MGKDDLRFPDEDIDSKKKNPFFEKIMEIGWNESFFGSGNYRPPTDIIETEKDFLIIIEIPGASKEAIEIQFEDDELTIKGEKKRLHEQVSSKYHNMERSFGAFEQRYRFKSSAVDRDGITAKYELGLLIVKAPKMGTRHDRSGACNIVIH